MNGLKRSSYIGVYKYTKTQVKAMIVINSIRIEIGRYNTEIEAAKAWDDYIRNNNLDRRLNFPDPEPENLIPNTRLIRLTRGKFALIDEEDYERVSQYKWHINSTGDLMYAVACIKIDGKIKNIKLHRFVMNFPDFDLDHKDNDGLNCMKLNLRPCNDSQNQMNRRTKSEFSSIYRGVSFSKDRNRWMSLIGYKKKMKYIGSFKVETEAAKAYDTKAKELFGEFARLNFPEL